MSTQPSPFAGVRALVFDLDGTLIDSELDLALSVNATLRHMGREALTHAQIFSYIGQGAARLVEQALGPGAGGDEVQQGLEYFLDYYRRHMLDNTVTHRGVREGLAALEGMSMAVLTNKPVRFSRMILEGLGLDRYFRFVYGGNSFPTKKPDPEGMQILLKDFGVPAKQALLVGDSEIDVRTARNAGTWCCCVTYGIGKDRLADDPPDVLIDSLTELATHLDRQTAGGHLR